MDEKISSHEVGNSTPQNPMHPAYTTLVDSMRVRNALNSVSNGIPSQNGISVPLQPPAPSMDTGLPTTLKKLGRKKKELPVAMVTKPLQTPGQGPVTVVVKNRFKHTKPGSHVIGTDKNRSALDILTDSYTYDEESGPPAKQSRTEESALVPTPRSVLLGHQQAQQVSRPSLIPSSPIAMKTPNICGINLLKSSISLCPSCHGKQTTQISNGVFKCNACSRTYLQAVAQSASNLIPAAKFYSPQASLLQQPVLKSSNAPFPAQPKTTRAKKPAETIDLISSDDDEEDEEEESETQEHTTTATAPLANNMPVKPIVTTASSNTAMNNPVASRMRLQGGEAATKNNNTQGVTPSPSPSPVRQETPNEYVFHCNKVMFGELYGRSVAPVKVVENRMYLSLECVIIRDNSQTNEKYTLSVGSNDVEQMFVYFGRVPSFVAIETSKKFASVACKRIGKDVLVPRSEQPRKRYIMLALNSAFKNDSEADTERQNLITAVSPWAKINVLSHADAIHVIGQAHLDVNQKEMCYGRTTKALGPVETLFIYPPSLKSGGIPITTLDLACLDEGTYLNDIIIDFYLKYICENIMSQEQRDKTYIFNSYFYKRLTQKTSSRADPASAHAQVKKWTRGVDIFEKDYVIIPINEHCHWYLAIICFHGQPLVKLDLNEKEEEEDEEQEKQNEDFIMKESSTSSEAESETEVNPQQPPQQQTPVLNSNSNEPQLKPTPHAAVENNEIDVSNQQQQQQQPNDSQQEQKPASALPPVPEKPLKNPTTPQNTPQNPTAPQKPPQNQTAPKEKLATKQANELEEFHRPCILIFDSLIGSGHSRVFTNIRHYLTQEWLSRKTTEEARVYSKESMKGCYPKIPRQNNDCDCGVFLLQYSEFFFSKPIRHFGLPMHLESWFTVDSVTKKRDDIKAIIAKLSEENKTVVPSNEKKQKSKTKKKV